MEVVASLSQGRTAAAQCGLFTHKPVPVIFEPPCNIKKKYLILRMLYVIRQCCVILGMDKCNAYQIKDLTPIKLSDTH